MLKANKEGKLVEFSLKQREQWLKYNYDHAEQNWPRLAPRPCTPYPFVEQLPTMVISSPPKNNKM